MKNTKFQVSKDSPALFFTSVTKDRLPIFRTDDIKTIACKAIDEARVSGRFALFAYVLMWDHIHWITDAMRKPSDILRYVDGIISHRVIEHLKERKYQASLNKLRGAVKARNYKYSMWDHHPNALWLTSESLLMQKVNYIHQNPIQAGLVERAEDYLWSSVRYWLGLIREDEPLRVDVDQISWHKRREGDDAVRLS
jgi:putative transposase